MGSGQQPLLKFLNGEFGRPHTVDPYVSATFYAADRFGQNNYREKKNRSFMIILLVIDIVCLVSSIEGAFFLKNEIKCHERFFGWLYDLEISKARLPLPDKIFFLSMGIKNIEANLQKKQERLLQDSYVTKEQWGWLDSAEKDLEHQKYSLLVGKEILPTYFDNYIVIDCEDESGRLLTPSYPSENFSLGIGGVVIIE